VYAFHDCVPTCRRYRKWQASGPDEFFDSKGLPRHLFSAPHTAQPRFNREYLTHLAAHARAILHFGYRAQDADFSLYRSFGRDLLTKQRGGSFEVDSLFYGSGRRPYLHIEVKADPREVRQMAESTEPVNKNETGGS
jgi:hypothetical protein